VPTEEWPRAIDTRLSSPQQQTSSDADKEGSEHNGARDEDERIMYVCEKIWGKRPAKEEPSLKRRKTARSSYGREVPVSIGGPTQP
jgi:hypothetical protein